MSITNQKEQVNTLNRDIREAIKKARVKQWEVAQALGIAEETLIRWLRHELSEERKAAILAAIQKVREA